MSPVVPADCVPPVPAEELWIRSADGLRLHVEIHGQSDAPTVVLAHGWTCSIAFWAPVIRQLADRYRVVAYDQRGHGRSEVPPSRARYSTRALAEDLEAVVVRTVPAGERAVLAGHSMGGMTIMAGADRPAVADRTAAALLVSTGPDRLIAELRVLPDVLRHPGLRRLLHRRVLRSRLPLGPVGPGSRAALKYATMGAGSPAGLVQAAAKVVHACPTAVRAEWAGVLDTLDVTAGLGRLAAPTAVIVGTDDRLTPPVHAHRIVAALPDPQGLLLLPGVGHMAPFERPVEVAAEIHRLAVAHLPAAHLPETHRRTAHSHSHSRSQRSVTA
ncbi:alpha/beta fold hydrolase [Kitasatospora sp. NPDC048239]|uniref:alpha/beta fold hydrolase n=1 Tax=Kitasatospora sp. NPDC048239 TaxID=3364046 RepID=UPI003712B00A